MTEDEKKAKEEAEAKAKAEAETKAKEEAEAKAKAEAETKAKEEAEAKAKAEAETKAKEGTLAKVVTDLKATFEKEKADIKKSMQIEIDERDKVITQLMTGNANDPKPSLVDEINKKRTAQLKKW